VLRRQVNHITCYLTLLHRLRSILYAFRLKWRLGFWLLRRRAGVIVGSAAVERCPSLTAAPWCRVIQVCNWVA
jgi:hypothetical protein